MRVDDRHMTVHPKGYKGLWPIPKEEKIGKHVGRFDFLDEVDFEEFDCEECGCTWEAARHLSKHAGRFCPLCGNGIVIDPLKKVPLSDDKLLAAESAE